MVGIIGHIDDKGTLLSQEHELLGYADEEVFIVDNFKDIPNTRVQRIHQIVVIICKRGKLQVVTGKSTGWQQKMLLCFCLTP